MTTDKTPGPAIEVESAERWVSGKSEAELLSDLKVYSARLQQDPHGIQDRLRVAAIQLRLGRIEEALIHYEGVLRAYVAKDQLLSAIALSRRILSIYPDIPRLQRILAALYARVPHAEASSPRPVTPIGAPREPPIVLGDDEEPTDQDVVVNRIFSSASTRSSDLLSEYEEDLRPTVPYSKPGSEAEPFLLTQRKRATQPVVADDDDDDPVLLTKKKK